MTDEGLHTRELLVRFHAGDEKTLGALVERHVPWIRARVRDRLGGRLREKAETQDFVHEAVVELLRHGPRFTVTSEDHFRALLARIVENVICDQHRWFETERRKTARERPLPTESVIDLDPRRAAAPTASATADRREREAWLRLGLELLKPEDREVLLLRNEEELSFEKVGERLGVSTDAARMRFERALARLGDVVARLRIEGVEAITREGRADS